MAKDITELAHDRGEDGELLPVTETIEVHGSEYEVDVHPATTGQQAEWRRKLEDQAEEAELSDDLVGELLDDFVVKDPSDFGAESWDDVRPAITDALGSVVMARLFDTEDVDEFREALNDAVEQATAGNAERASETADAT